VTCYDVSRPVGARSLHLSSDGGCSADELMEQCPLNAGQSAVQCDWYSDGRLSRRVGRNYDPVVRRSVVATRSKRDEVSIRRTYLICRLNPPSRPATVPSCSTSCTIIGGSPGCLELHDQWILRVTTFPAVRVHAYLKFFPLPFQIYFDEKFTELQRTLWWKHKLYENAYFKGNLSDLS